MKGFLSSAAVLIFAFALISAAYTFMLSQGDLGNSALTGLVVESSRSAVEAETAECANNGDGNYNGAAYAGGIGWGLVQVNGNTSDLTSYDAGFANITVHLERSYPPTVHFTDTDATTDNKITWIPCDIQNDVVSYAISPNNGAYQDIGADTNYSAAVPGSTYKVQATDAEGNVGYSALITAT